MRESHIATFVGLKFMSCSIFLLLGGCSPAVDLVLPDTVDGLEVELTSVNRRSEDSNWDSVTIECKLCRCQQ